MSQLFARPGCTALSESRLTSPSYTLPMSTCSMADPDWRRMSRLGGASLSPMVTVSALFADCCAFRPLNMATAPTMMAMATTAAIMMPHLFGLGDFDVLTRALRLSSVLAAPLELAALLVAAVVASALPYAPCDAVMIFLYAVIRQVLATLALARLCCVRLTAHTGRSPRISILARMPHKAFTYSP